MQILSGFRHAIERFANGGDAGGTRRRSLPAGLSWGGAVGLIGVATSIFTVSALAYYHVVVGGERQPSGLFQGAVVSLYRFLGFVPSFFLGILALVWSSLRFVTGPVKGMMIRGLAILSFCLSLSIMVALARDLAPGAGGMVGSYFGSRLLWLIGSSSASLLLMASLVVATLLLSTDWFFFRYFQGLLGDAPGRTWIAVGHGRSVAGGSAAGPAMRPVAGPIGEPQPLVKPASEPRWRAEPPVVDLSIRTTSTPDDPAAEAMDDEASGAARRVSLDGLPHALDAEGRSPGLENDAGPGYPVDVQPSDTEHGEPPASPETPDAPPRTPVGGHWQADSFSRPVPSADQAPEPQTSRSDADPDPAGAPDRTAAEESAEESTEAEAAGPAERSEEAPVHEDQGAAAPRQETLFSDRAPAGDLLQEATDLVIRTKRASVAFLQRRLRIRFAEASALLERMEQLGVIGPYQEGSHRAVLMSLEQWRNR